MRFSKVTFWITAWCCTANLSAAPFLTGKVTDEQGRPITGASVKIMDCVGTCLGGAVVITDEQGRYVFEKKPFDNSPFLIISLPGRYEVSRAESGPKLHEADSETPRQIDFILGTPAALGVRLEGEVPVGWTQEIRIRAGKDAKVERFDLFPLQTSTKDSAYFQSLPRNENLHIVVTRRPVLVESNDPKAKSERPQDNVEKSVEIVSAPFRLLDPQEYNLIGLVSQDSDGSVVSIRCNTLTDALGNDRTKELIVDDRRFGPPVDRTVQDKAQELLERVKTVAQPWNALPSKSIASYEYDAIDPQGSSTHVRIDRDSPNGPAWKDIARLRGFAYMPPLRWLFAQPENVVFHDASFADDQVTLQYQLKSPRGFSIGIGVGPRWNGFISKPFSTGTIVIDPKSSTVIEHRFSEGLLAEQTVETFTDYVAVNNGQAPRSIRIQTGKFDFQFSFKIHGDKLWLLDAARRKDQPESPFKVDNVVVNMAE